MHIHIWDNYSHIAYLNQLKKKKIKVENHHYNCVYNLIKLNSINSQFFVPFFYRNFIHFLQVQTSGTEKLQSLKSLYAYSYARAVEPTVRY